MSCISPMAPLRERARGLKLDSTLMMARTRLGSTRWRAAACSMAESTAAEVVRGVAEAAESGSCNSGGARFSAAEDAGNMRLTSAAAKRAARMADGVGGGTAFQRRSRWLQYTS